MPRAGSGHLYAVDPELAGILAQMPREEVRCRRGHHRWARDTVLPEDPWPNVVRAWPTGDGRIKVEDPCVDCGLAWRVTRTGYDGALDAFARSHIVYHEDWVRVPQGLDRRKRTIGREGDRRGKKQNTASLAAALARTEQSGAQPVQPVRFAHADAG
jgi:hypothetical protein